MMEIGEARTVAVRARPHWNDTKIRLISGSGYRFSTSGRWWDMVVPCGAGGYSCALLRIAESRRRVPREPWFALIGSIDADEARTFLIGADRELVAPATGDLTCFANDLRRMHWNNWGAVELTVLRVT
jgi:hypothetical protein